MILGIHPLIALGVLASTAATDAAYVFFNAAVSGRRRFWAAIAAGRSSEDAAVEAGVSPAVGTRWFGREAAWPHRT